MDKVNINVIYRKLLLTKNKKNYAGVITGELGKLLTKPVLDMKGKDIALLKLS